MRISQVISHLNYYIHIVFINMKIGLLLLLLVALSQAHIYSSDSKVTYDYDGNPIIYHLYMSLQTGLGADDYLKIIFPTKIHVGSTQSAMSVKLISFSNNLEIVDTNFQVAADSSNPNYIVSFGVAMTANKWYEIQIFPNQNPTDPRPYHGLIQVQALSTWETDPIIYDSNMAFSYISIEPVLGSPNGMSITVSSPAGAEANRVASIYTIKIQVAPSLSNAHGGNFTLKIHYDSSDPLHNTDDSQLLDFAFMGLCQSVTPSSGTAATLNQCQISDDLTEIYFSVNSISNSQPICIQTQVSNPMYASTRGIRAHYVDFISGVVLENGYQASALSVGKIAINDLADERVYLLWGISSQTPDTQLTSIGFGFYRATGSSVGPFNSFNAGWSFSETSPIEGRYQVQMYLGADGFLQGSIAHNLPKYSDLQVYCHYDIGTKYLICDNVGPFINTDYRYFISGKAYFSTSGSVAGFGDVKILPVVYDSDGNQLSNVVLYENLLSSDSITLMDSSDYLDMGGYHNLAGPHDIGMGQIISYEDDGTLSSTANAMDGFMNGDNSTIGIVPDLGVSQQLLFLLKVNSIDSSGSGDDYTLKILYNNKVIGFESGADERGLDFVGYDATNSIWSIQLAPCHIDGHVVCEKYNNDTDTYNTQIRQDGDGTHNFYGLYKFQCGETLFAESCYNGNCEIACNMFTGEGSSDQSSSVVAMRKVTFPSTQFHSSLYADDTLLDFLIVYDRGGTVTSRSLINAYTMVGARLQNIKASYVNYYESTSSYNKGMRIPTMIRIAGGVLPRQSRNATVVGVFFDDNIDAHTFYTHKDESYQVGCSTENCIYYPNTGIQLFPNDIWHTMRRVQFYDIPPIQNEFNLLVPVTPSASRTGLPDTLTLAFFTQDHSIGDASNLLKTVSVYRLFGSVVANNIDSGSIGPINGLSVRGINNFDSYFTATDPSSYAGSISYALNTSNINANPPNNTFTFGYTSGAFTINNQYGAGVTLTSFYYNIFQSSTLAFEQPPTNTAQTCSIFGYIYNQQTPASNPERNGKPIYTAFCPIDGPLTMNTANGNIHFSNPQYPNVLTTGFPLSSILTYAISQPDGQLVDYKHQTGPITAFVRSCTTAKLHPYYPTSSGKQRATFTVSTPQIRMSNILYYEGYSQFKVQIVLPVGISNINMLGGAGNCEISNPELSCTTSGGSTSQITISYTGTDVLTVTYFQISLYATTSGSLGSTGDYTLTVYLPQQTTNSVLYGTSYSPQATYCSCTSNFKIGNTPLGTSMNLQNPVLLSNMKETMSTYYFDFGSYSYRDTFFSTSYFQFNWGYLTQPSQTYRNSKNNFRCRIYEVDDDGVATISSKWSKLQFSSFTAVRLRPKQEIDDPASYLFRFQCFGAAVATSASNLELYWKDSVTVQTATPLSVASLSLVNNAASALTASIHQKRFINAGMKAFYTFVISSSSALDEDARIYFDFNFNLNSRLDNEGYVQCYIRTTAGTADADATFSYCQFNYERQLVLWNNLAIGSSTNFYVDIFNIQQPKSTDTSPNIITISIDTDGQYFNGVTQKVQITDSAPSNTAINDIKIISTSVDTDFIRSPQQITISFDTVDTNVIASGTNIYLLMPGDYGEWITRGATIDHSTDDCYMEADNAVGANILNACAYISKRILKMTIDTTTSTGAHTLILKGVYSPSKLPNGRNNQYRFKLFTSSSQTTIQRYSFTDYSKHLTLRPDDTLIDLSWKYISISTSDSLAILTDISDQTYIIYMGYYKNAIELRQSIYPSNFITEMELTLTSHSDTDFIHKGGSIVQLGSQHTYIKMAANSNNIDAGLYTLQYTKTGDTFNEYTAVPPLTVVVSNKLCALETEQVSYSMPIRGMTLPIKISAISCIPTQNITITPTFSMPSQVSMDTDLSSNVLTSESLDGQMYIIVRDNNNFGLTNGDVITVTFAITGPNSAYYQTIPPITISVVDSAAYQTLPVATSLSDPTLSYNKATFTLQCSMASRIYWGLGIYPSILNTQAVDFEARIISEGEGLATNFTEPQDIFMKVYGMNYVSTTQTFHKTVYGLKSNAQYIFKYYCINQMGSISDSQSITFNSLNYGAYLMKVSMTFRGSLDYGQYQDLTCSLAQNFEIPYSRVMSQVMSTCEQSSTIFYPFDNSTIDNQANSDGEFVYNFYILPDYTIPIDQANSNIRSALSLSSTSTTIFTSTANFASLPELIQIQTEDIQFFATPTMEISDPLSGLNSVVITASITNMNGFIIVGCMEGTFNTTTMTLPTTSNIKKGLLEENVYLHSVKMLYAIQNYNTSIEFSGLEDNTRYSFFYYSTTEDPSLTAQATSVRVLYAQTLQALLVNINWMENLQAIWIMSLAIIMFVGF